MQQSQTSEAITMTEQELTRRALAQSLIESLVSDNALRDSILSALADCIQAAHEQNPAGWDLTLNPEGRYLRLNVGRIFVFDVQQQDISISAVSSSIPEDLRQYVDRDSHRVSPEGFKSLKGVTWQSFPPADFPNLWDRLRPSCFEAIELAAKGVRRTPYFPSHNTEALEHVESVSGRMLPRPNYHFTQQELDGLIELLRARYPGWDSFGYGPFVADEVEYKRRAAKTASELLGRGEFHALLDRKDYRELTNRLKKIAQSTNLLFLGVPSQGDLSILHQENLDEEGLARSLFDLLHGEGSAPERLQRYLEWVRERGYPSKWTFPTYYLFLLHPEEEMFVKPTITTTFARQILLGGEFTAEPTAEKYSLIREVSHQLRDSLSERYGINDMIDIQSLMYVCATTSDDRLLTKAKRRDFEKLYAEFQASYVSAEEGKRHAAMYSAARESAQANVREIEQAQARGESTTDLILLKLLPYADNPANHEKGAWIHHAPAINGDVKKWFEAKHWIDPEDWPAVAQAIFGFVGRCVEDPEQLSEACREFDEKKFTKGFQTGMLTPILNALRPQSFVLVNNKSRKVINHFCRRKHQQSLQDYASTNETAFGLVEELEDVLHSTSAPDLIASDLLDMFSHWLVAIRKYDLGESFWKIAPGENAWQWEECLEGGFIGIGWEEFGDLSEVGRERFEELKTEFADRGKGWSLKGTEQLWTFAKKIKKGDRIVANRGTSEVLGIGTVAGSYVFVPDSRQGHRLPVDWEDITKRTVDKKGWKQTILKLDYEEFQEIASAPAINGSKGEPGKGFFTPKTFGLLAGLHESPTREFYSNNKDDFERYVEDPFQDLFSRVIAQLPPAITKLMETEKNLYSRIPKNDYGRGGAWDFYWGAIYPKGGKRISDAQLSVWLNRDYLYFGFYIGEYGSEARDLFLRNVRENQDVLIGILESDLDRKGIVFGSSDQIREEGASLNEIPIPSLRQWLQDPSAHGIRVGRMMSREQTLEISREALCSQIMETFRKLFPLVLLTTSAVPIEEISSYLEDGDERQPTYTLEEMSKESGFDLENLQRWKRAIERKGQAILYGPPGTGKTYIAERLARHLVGGGRGFVDLVQFHPAYAYEDFMQGIRPATTLGGDLTYDLAPGRFLDFSRRAQRMDDICVLIIDEINRANLSRVFGELMYLLEYREKEMPLAGGSRFAIPSNVRIIGTMNTADRSIALVDHALRRRFAFLSLRPNFDVLRHFHARMNSTFPVEGLIRALERLNRDIGDPHYEVGITYFLQRDLEGQIEDVWCMEIEPYLEEYFYNQREKLSEHSWEKIGPTILAR